MEDQPTRLCVLAGYEELEQCEWMLKAALLTPNNKLLSARSDALQVYVTSNFDIMQRQSDLNGADRRDCVFKCVSLQSYRDCDGALTSCGSNFEEA